MVSMNLLRCSWLAALSMLPTFVAAAPSVEPVNKRACSTFKIQFNLSGTDFDGWYVAPYSNGEFQLVESISSASSFHIDSNGYLRYGAAFVLGNTLETTFAIWRHTPDSVLDSKFSCWLGDGNSLSCVAEDHTYIYYYQTTDGSIVVPEMATQPGTYSISAVC